MGSHGRAASDVVYGGHGFGRIIHQPNGLFARYFDNDLTHINMSAKDIVEWAGESIGHDNAINELVRAVYGYGYDWFELALKWIREERGARAAHNLRKRCSVPRSQVKMTPRPKRDKMPGDFEVFKWQTKEFVPVWLSFREAVELRGMLSEWIALQYGRQSGAAAEMIDDDPELSSDTSLLDIDRASPVN